MRVLRKEGRTLEGIADAMKEPYTTIRNRIKRIRDGGLDGLCDRKSPGAECRPDRRQRRRLTRDPVGGPQKCGYDSAVRTMLVARRHIKKSSTSTTGSTLSGSWQGARGPTWTRPGPGTPGPPPPGK